MTRSPEPSAFRNNDGVNESHINDSILSSRVVEQEITVSGQAPALPSITFASLGGDNNPSFQSITQQAANAATRSNDSTNVSLLNPNSIATNTTTGFAALGINGSSFAGRESVQVSLNNPQVLQGGVTWNYLPALNNNPAYSNGWNSYNPGYYPQNSGYNPSQYNPGYYSQNSGYNPSQYNPGYYSQNSGYNPSQYNPGYYPQNSGYNPSQYNPGYYPQNSGYNPSQYNPGYYPQNSGYNPSQYNPGYYPQNPGYKPYQYDPGYYPQNPGYNPYRPAVRPEVPINPARPGNLLQQEILAIENLLRSRGCPVHLELGQGRLHIRMDNGGNLNQFLNVLQNIRTQDLQRLIPANQVNQVENALQGLRARMAQLPPETRASLAQINNLTLTGNGGVELQLNHRLPFNVPSNILANAYDNNPNNPLTALARAAGGNLQTQLHLGGQDNRVRFVAQQETNANGQRVVHLRDIQGISLDVRAAAVPGLANQHVNVHIDRLRIAYPPANAPAGVNNVPTIEATIRVGNDPNPRTIPLPITLDAYGRLPAWVNTLNQAIDIQGRASNVLNSNQYLLPGIIAAFAGQQPNPYAPAQNPYAPAPNQYGPNSYNPYGPNPYAPTPNQYGPNPYAPTQNPYAPAPNQYGPNSYNPYGPNPYAPTQNPYAPAPNQYGPNSYNPYGPNPYAPTQNPYAPAPNQYGPNSYNPYGPNPYTPTQNPYAPAPNQYGPNSYNPYGPNPYTPTQNPYVTNPYGGLYLAGGRRGFFAGGLFSGGILGLGSIFSLGLGFGGRGFGGGGFRRR